MSTAAYIVYRDYPNWGSYHAVAANGTEIAANPNDPGPVLQAALNQSFWNDPSSGPGAGDVYLRAGDYLLPGTFSGFDLHSYTQLTMDPTARLAVPNGYTGYVFRLQSSDSAGSLAHSTLKGGQIVEQGAAQHQWTGILLEAAGSGNPGILFNRLQDVIIYDAGTGLLLHVSGLKDFINGNRIEFLRMWHCRRFVSFRIDQPYQAGEQDFGIVANTFVELECQCDSNIQVGVDNVCGAFNSFFDVKVWDTRNINQNAMSAVISNQSANTRIFGGFMAGGPPGQFVDNGVDTELVAAT